MDTGTLAACCTQTACVCEGCVGSGSCGDMCHKSTSYAAPPLSGRGEGVCQENTVDLECELSLSDRACSLVFLEVEESISTWIECV